VEGDRVTLCKVLEGKRPFGALNVVHSVTLGDLKAVLQNSAVKKGPTFATAAPPTQV